MKPGFMIGSLPDIQRENEAGLEVGVGGSGDVVGGNIKSEVVTKL